MPSVLASGWPAYLFPRIATIVLYCLMQVGKTRGVPKGAGRPHPAPPRKKGLFGRFSRMSGNLNPFEEEEANPRHHQNLHMTVGKVGKSHCNTIRVGCVNLCQLLQHACPSLTRLSVYSTGCMGQKFDVKRV